MTVDARRVRNPRRRSLGGGGPRFGPPRVRAELAPFGSGLLGKLASFASSRSRSPNMNDLARCVLCSTALAVPALAQFGPSNPLVDLTYVKASNTDAGDRFGTAAICGDTMVIGATHEASNAVGVGGNQTDDSIPGAGAAYVYVFDGTAWQQQAYLKASSPDGNDWFGGAVAISGDTIVVGAIAEDSAAVGVDGDDSDDTASLSGAAYVFVRSGTTWSQQAYLKASNTGAFDEFGASVAIDGDTVVVGAPGEASASGNAAPNQADDTAAGAGAVYVFHRAGTTWTQQAYLKSSHPDVNDRFGGSVSISGDGIAIGASSEASSATGVNGDASDNGLFASGAVFVFRRSGVIWNQEAYLKAAVTDSGDGFGASVAIAGNRIVVGATQEDSAATGVGGDATDDTAVNAGAAYVFEKLGLTWAQQAYLKASNAQANDRFGTRVAVDGDSIVVSASNERSQATGEGGDETDNSIPQAGAAYVFRGVGSAWSQEGYLKASAPGVGDIFGTGLAIDGVTVVVGAIREDSGATGIDGDDTDNSAAASGAAYVFWLCGSDDPLEDNDDCASAPPAPAGGADGLMLFGDAGGIDEDVFTVQAASGSQVIVDLDFAHAFGDIDLFLYESGAPTCHDGVSFVASSTSATDGETIVWTNLSPVTKTLDIVIDAVGAGFTCNAYDLALSVSVGAGCPGTNQPTLSSPASNSTPFTITCPGFVQSCGAPPVVIFGVCSFPAVPIPPPLGCGVCGLVVNPAFASVPGPVPVGTGLPIGFEFCAQCGCIATGCIELSLGLPIVVGP